VVDEPAGVVERILDALGVPVPVTWRPTSTTTRQADHVNADWVRRYRSSRVSGAPA
jgi:LPS sulfotransferase NodH